MAEQRAKRTQVILKRQVVTKAVVTEKFKQFLLYELTENVQFYRKKAQELRGQLQGGNKNDSRAMQAQGELDEADQYVQSEATQKKFIDDLKNGTLYSQGPVDGFVTVSVGDNLYEKLGGIELVVEDGIVKTINAAESQFQKVT